VIVHLPAPQSTPPSTPQPSKHPLFSASSHTLSQISRQNRLLAAKTALLALPALRFAHGEEDLSTPDKPIRVPTLVLKQVEENDINIILDTAEDPKSGAPNAVCWSPQPASCWSPQDRDSSARYSSGSQWPALSRDATREAKIPPLSPQLSLTPRPPCDSPSGIMAMYTDFSSLSGILPSPSPPPPLPESSELSATRRELFPPFLALAETPVRAGSAFSRYHGLPKAAVTPSLAAWPCHVAAEPPTPTPTLDAMWDVLGRAEVELTQREIPSSGCGAALDKPWAWGSSKIFANPNLPIGCPAHPPPPTAGYHPEPPPTALLPMEEPCALPYAPRDGLLSQPPHGAPAEYARLRLDDGCLGLQLQRARHELQRQQYQQVR